MADADLYFVDFLQFIHGIQLNQLQLLNIINQFQQQQLHDFQQQNIDNADQHPVLNERIPLREIREVYYDEFSDNEFIIQFRFPRYVIDELVELLHIPVLLPREAIGRCCCTGKDALLITLRRLAFTSRYSDLRHLFQRSEAYLCQVFNYTIHHIYVHFSHMLRANMHPNLIASCKDDWFRAVAEIGGPDVPVFGCIDGMCVQIDGSVELCIPPSSMAVLCAQTYIHKK